MVNLYELERQALTARLGPRRPSDRRSPSRVERGRTFGEQALAHSLRSRIGVLLVRLGLQLSGSALPGDRAGIGQCACVPVQS